MTRQIVPQSFSQRRYWFSSRHAGDAVCCRTVAFEYDGLLEPQRVEALIRSIMARHASLRSSYVLQKNVPVQVVHDCEGVAVDISTQQLKEEELPVRLLAFSRAGPDLAVAPAFTAALFLLEHTSVLALNVHEICLDRWSDRLLLDELNEVESRIEHQHPQSIEPNLSYWEERLRGAKYDLRLPTDYARPLSPSYEAGTAHLNFDAAEVEAFRSRVRERGTTEFALHVATLGILLRNWTGTDDVVVGTVIAGRNIGNERAIGCFTNLLPLRITPRADFIGGLTAQLREDLRHGECPFESIVQRVDPERAAGKNPLFSVAIYRESDLRPSAQEHRTGRFSLAPHKLPSKADLDLTLVIRDGADGIEIACEYDKSLFSGQTISHLLAAYRAILQGAEMPRALQEQATEVARRELPIQMVGDFTLDPIIDAFYFWSGVTGCRTHIRPPIYGQVFRQLCSTGSELDARRTGVNCIFLRYEQWLVQRGEEVLVEESAAAAEQYVVALSGLASRNTATHVVILCQPDPRSEQRNGFDEFRRRCDRSWEGVARLAANVHLIRPAEIQLLYAVSRTHEESTPDSGDMPFSEDYYLALGSAAFRKVASLHRSPVKVVVVDCDHTLWEGVCSESAVSELRISGELARFQRFLREQKAKGMLLCLASQNDAPDVWRVFEEHPDMVLRRDEIVTARIDWSGKPAKLASIATELGLSLDSMVFMDDDPVQCAAVRSQCPQVTTIQVPRAGLLKMLEHLWVFDAARRGVGDRQRTDRYKAERARMESRGSSASYADFLEKLDLRFQFVPLAQAEHIDRLSELSHRTNQFNLTGGRLSSRDIEAALESEKSNGFVVGLQDRFGDYGIIGGVLYSRAKGCLCVSHLFLSCRALNRGVEHRMFQELGRVADAAQLNHVRIACRKTAKNGIALSFLQELCGGPDSLDTESGYQGVPTAVVSAVRYRADEPGRSPATVDPDGQAIGARGELSNLSTVYEHIAWHLNDVSQIRAAKNAVARPWNYRAVAAEYSAPKTEEEARLTTMWSNVLGVEASAIGVHDRFAELGGQSLLAMRMLNGVRRAFGIQLSVREFVQGPTIAELARLVCDKVLTRRLGTEAESLARSGKPLEWGDL